MAPGVAPSLVPTGEFTMATDGHVPDIDPLWLGEVPEDDLEYLGHGDVGDDDPRTRDDRLLPGGLDHTTAAAGSADLGHALLLIAGFVKHRKWRRRYDLLDE
jgi:hypothetical protein